MDSWEKYSKHVINSLERLEKKLDAHVENAKVTSELHTLTHAKLEIKINKVATDMKWFTRIASGLSVIGSSAISMFVKKHI